MRKSSVRSISSVATEVITLAPGIKIRDVALGQGKAAQAGHTIRVYYITKLANQAKTVLVEQKSGHGVPFSAKITFRCA
jgi:hypothetical protein